MTYCPRCQQPLPEPLPRYCPSCGHDLQETGAPIVPVGSEPGGGYPPPPGGKPSPAGGPPWERRQQIGFASALVETTQQVLTAPTKFFQSMPVTGGIGGPLLYGVIAGYIGLVASAVYSFVLRSALGSSLDFGRGGELERIMPLMSSGMGLVGQIVFGPLLVVIGLFIFTAIIHVCLLALGGAPHGFEATFRVAAYSEASMVIRIVPICGDVAAVVYYVILTIIGLAEAHHISAAKAAAAVLLPVVLLCCCCAAGILMAVGGLASLLGHVR
jgi:hypothetical protein